MMMTKTITLFLLLILAGCSTSPSISFKREAAPNIDEALVYIYRDTGFQGTTSRNAAIIRLNGKIIGKLSASSYIPIKLPAGKHTLSARSRSFGNDNAVIIAEKLLHVGPGKTVFLKYSETIEDVQFTGSGAYASTNAHFHIMSPSIATNEITGAKLSSL